MELPKYCTVSFLPRDRYSHTERLSNRLKMKEEEQHKAGWAWMNNRQSIMDDKLTKFPLSASLSMSFSYISYIHFLTVFSLPLLFFLNFSPLSLCSSLTVTPCHCFEAHVLEEDGGCHPPLSLLAAFGREPLYFMGFSNLLETFSLLSASQKSPIRGQAM